MPDQPPFQLLITGPARRDIASIATWSMREFGQSAALRYKALIDQALQDIQDDPERVGSMERPEMVAGARTYQLSLSRDRMTGVKVQSPRHFILYRQSAASVIEIARILHDGRDLARHLPAAYRPADQAEGV